MCRSNFGDQAGPFRFEIVSLAVAAAGHTSGSFRDGRIGSWFRGVVEVVKAGWARVWTAVSGFFEGSSSGAVRLE